MSAKETIDARAETIGTLITFSSNPYTLVVPVYQRFYQWDRSKVLDLLRLTDPDTRDFGFIGTMVFVQIKNQSLEVVDGQQRLISIVIILCALRDFIREYISSCKDPQIVQMLDDMQRDIQAENLLVSKSYSDSTDNPRIVFNRLSYETFKNRYLTGDTGFMPEDLASRKEINNFANNYEEAKKYITDKYSHHKPKEITPLLNKRLERLKGLVVNAIYITKHEYAGEVFESINGTGIILKLSELVKNYVYRSVASKADAHAKWDQIDSNCDGKLDLIERVIKYEWQNRVEESKDFEIFRSIKANTSSVDEYLNRLVRVSKIFAFYLHPSIENFKYLKLPDNRNDKNHIIKLASTLRIIGVKQFLRLIIALDLVKEHITINDYRRFLLLIHNFQVRAKISSVQPNELEGLYSRYGRRLQRLSKQIAEESLNSKEARTLISNLLFTDFANDLRKLNPEDSFATGFLSYSRTKSTGKDFFKYLLASIESNMQRSELVIDTRDNQITLEEIYPQEPATEWSVSDLDQDDIYRLANATILTGRDNGAGSNKYISEKYEIFKNSKLQLNKELVTCIDKGGGKWDKEALAKRSRSLLDYAIRIWEL